MSKRILVTGAGGFIGGYVAQCLREEGEHVVAVDIKRHDYFYTDKVQIADLRNADLCMQVCNRIDEVYHFAADMGGVGYIGTNKGREALNNIRIDANMLNAALVQGVKKFFYASSACVYPIQLQAGGGSLPLAECDAIPANPDGGYGWEKLFMEQMLDYHYPKIEPKVVRFHNVFGPNGTYDGGKEKSMAALCRKVALADNKGEIEIWGDGNQVRNYIYIDDAVNAICTRMSSPYIGPVNISQSESISINELVTMLEIISGKRLKRIYRPDAPVGVSVRRCDNTVAAAIGITTNVKLYDGVRKTYEWIYGQLLKEGRL
jgi:GDP-D-mannose 3', 5'-epimerase